MPPLKRFPSNAITPHGAYHVLHDRIPQMSLTSPDETVVFHLMGGLAIPDFVNSPGRVEIKDLKGLIPPWRIIDQKGASQDGVSFVDALYEPIEIELTARVKGADPADCRRVARYLVDSLDIKKTSRLAFFDHHLGYWWSDVRWFKPPVDPVGAIRNKTQDLSLRLRADTGFWQSFPCVDDFTFSYGEASDAFTGDDPDDLGPDWTIRYHGSGSGVLRKTNGAATSNLTGGRTAVARHSSYIASTNNVVVETVIGTHETWWYPTDAVNEIWARMNNTGDPGTHGIRLRIGRHFIRLSYFVGGVETLLRQVIQIIPPLPGERYRLIAGAEGDERRYSVMRGGATLFSVKETGTGSALGALYRGAGFAMKADGIQWPARIRSWSVGVNTTVSQAKFLRMVNVGDQDMYYNFIVYGPGTFKFWNGPSAGAQEYVEFGPLLKDQVMYLRTDPRKRGVVDMTSVAPTPQQLTWFQRALRDFLNFATGNNATPLAVEIQSKFGIRPPQGNPYSLLRGRWSQRAAIPPKSPGRAAQEYFVKVSIDDGTADSKIVITGTPLRRSPL